MAVTATFSIQRAKNIRSAARAAQWLTDRVAASGRPLHLANVVTLGGTISPALEAALRCSRETRLMPVARPRHRTAAESTRPRANHDARASVLPTDLWPGWALQFSPRGPSGRPAAQRADELLTAACLLAGNTTSIRAAVRLTGTTVSSHNVSTPVAGLTRHQDGADVLHTLILLADHRDQHGSPIDYARRRALFTTRRCFVDPTEWQNPQRRPRANHTPDIAHAQRWIFHTLSGSPPRLAHPAIAPATASQRQQYLRFRWASCPPRPNCSPTPGAQSSTNMASTHPSSGPTTRRRPSALPPPSGP
ncbi:hypothetical protein [Streptomyces pseudovenezuelae]|uniref:Uncharacterized protein n=1 Tax=Streptomyces pseudovenezuelae TaxID=67350 RepID=A0ABT6LXL7_9ACTN|nr:hypothetical protein [Streptomyces pseudovenezuelae]MDH6221048.1 hypothetical protein [Streptomyces pseudovenezuelae]